MASPSKRVRGASIASIVCVAIVALAVVWPGGRPVYGDEPLTVDTLFDWVTRFSNWGRWGPDDQRGTDNFITPAKRARASRLVRFGIAVPTARRPHKVAFDPSQPFIEFQRLPDGTLIDTRSLAPKPTEPLAVDDTNPFFFWANPPGYGSDRWNFALAGVVHSHLDAMCHVGLSAATVPRLFPEVLNYNGVSRVMNNTAAGCAKQGIENNDIGIFTRGVLFDATLLPELREPGHDWLAPGTRVMRRHLKALEKIEHVRVRSGDVVLLYTGRWKRRAALGPWPPICSGGAVPPACGIAGFYADTIPFMFEREVAHMGHDAWNDVTPGGFDAFAVLVYHGFQATMGLSHFDNLDLEALAETARQLGRYEFLLTTAPFPVEGGITSPVNPIAMF